MQTNSDDQQNYKITQHPLVKGETISDWKNLKAYKQSMGTFYTGPFSTARGNPRFGIIPVIGKYIFLIYAFYYIISKNYKYSIYVILLYAIGAILNAIRFYYVNSLSNEGEDSRFLTFVAYDNLFGAFIAFVAIIYCLLKGK
jgi:hypothetical protein